jgi:aspartyl-tRNA(Asn)/glutamyl-tRNA(Gln) amidotransferase subunit A
MDATATADAIRTGQRTATDVVTSALERAAKHNGLGAFLSLQAKPAQAMAARVDAAFKNGDAVGPLAGVPFAVKDNISQAGETCGCASKLLSGFVSPTTATAVSRLITAGAIPIGRTNMDEFGMGSSGENSAFGPTQNPWDKTRVPGGSSSGSAAAVAAGVVPFALGSDTGGSVRQPASFCGLVGLKPTYGRISRSGLVAFASSLDQIGPISTSCRDAALLLRIMSGIDPKDTTTLNDAPADWLETLPAVEPGQRVGLPRQCWTAPDSPVAAVARAALACLVERGVQVVAVDLPSLELAIPAYYLLTSAEASSNLGRFDGVRFGSRAKTDTLDALYKDTRSQFFGPEVQRRILLGTYALAAGYAQDHYDKATAVRAKMRAEISAVLKTVDVLAMPTAPTVAFRLGEKSCDPVSMYLSDVFTTPPSLTGHPAISVPAGLCEGLPVGLQLVGAHQAEATLLGFATAIEDARGSLKG